MNFKLQAERSHASWQMQQSTIYKGKLWTLSCVGACSEAHKEKLILGVGMGVWIQSNLKVHCFFLVISRPSIGLELPCSSD